MRWTDKQILDTLKLIEQSDYDEVKLETEHFKLHVRKSGAPMDGVGHGVAATVSQADVSRTRAAESGAVPAAQQARVSPPAASVVVPAGMIAIRAPLVGTFYRAPAPHSPPFVDVGATVTADDTVCLIEVMKLFNTIKAGVSGRVVSIHAENAATVRRDDVLVIIAPQ
jgi:acetyl-CoA carboxylase biotin carboxyl carrier protein